MPDSNDQMDRPLVWLLIGLGAVCVATAAIYRLGNLGERVLTFRVDQVFWMGLFCIGAGFLLARVLRTARSPFRGAGWLMLGIGGLGLVLALAHRLFNLGDNFLSFDLAEIFTMGLVYAAVGLILLLAADRLWKARESVRVMETLRIERQPMATPKTTSKPISDEFASAKAAMVAVPTGWQGVEAEMQPVPEETRAAAGAWQASNPDDLTLLADIDAQTQTHLNEMGIFTYEALSAANGDDLTRMVIEKGRPELAHEAEGWPHLARFAADGNVQAYMLYHDVLAKGRSMSVEALAALMQQPDDLSILEGVGPKIQDALSAAGIKTFTQVATMTPDELEHLVRVEAGVRMVGGADTWPRQARYVIEHDLRGFLSYIQELVAGREQPR